MKRGVFIVITFFFSLLFVHSQNSENGWEFPASGQINALVLFIDIDYDTLSYLNPYPNNSKWWNAGDFPNWKGELLSSVKDSESSGSITRFYDEMSFGQHQLKGVYFDQLIQVKASEIRNLNSRNAVFKGIEKQLEANQSLHDFLIKELAYLDQWTWNSKPGMAKEFIPNELLDMVILMVRNVPAFGNGSGFVTQSKLSLGNVSAEAYSVFGAGDGVPFQIFRHEYAHMLLGGNNFHCCGGQHAGGGYNHLIGFQGGWGLLGGYHSSFMTANAWDRERLGWKHPDKTMLVSAQNEEGEEVNSKLKYDANQKEIRLVVRDFVTSGDAVQIQLPHIPDSEYPQYIWLENHQGTKNNGSEFDRYQFDDRDCIPDTKAGLYAYLQIGHNQKEGDGLYGDYGDFIRPMPADGFYDVAFEDTLIQNNWCVGNNWYKPYYKPASLKNPLTGTGDLEQVPVDLDGDDRIKANENYKMGIEKKLFDYKNHLAMLGNPRHAFTVLGNNTIGIGTNPSSASIKTLTSHQFRKFDPKENSNIYLNGLQVRIIKEMKDGALLIGIKFDERTLYTHQRWTGDTIFLNNEPGIDLILNRKVKLELDQGLTPTRINKPLVIDGNKVFANRSVMVLKAGSSVLMKRKSKWNIKNKSTLIIEKGARITKKRKAKIIIQSGGKVIDLNE